MSTGDQRVILQTPSESSSFESRWTWQLDREHRSERVSSMSYSYQHDSNRHRSMSGLLGLSAYSDDDDSVASGNSPKRPAADALKAGTSVAPPPPAQSAVAGLIGQYSDSDASDNDEGGTEESKSESARGDLTAGAGTSHAHHSVASAAPSAQSAASTSIASNLRELVAQPASAAAASYAPGHAAHAEDDDDAPVDPILLSALPPLPSGPLAPALAVRHAQNLARQEAMRASGRGVPLVASLLRMKSFHNPCILDTIASKLNIVQYGSNLDEEKYWREQNLPEGRREDDYIEIKKQAEDATNQRLATRTSIDFVPASSPATAGGASAAYAAAAATAARFAADLSSQNPSRPTNVPAVSTAAAAGSRKSKWDSAPSASAATASAEEEARKRQKR